MRGKKARSRSNGRLPLQFHLQMDNDAERAQRPLQPRRKRETSIMVFRRFLKTESNPNSGGGDEAVVIDASGVVSFACYEAWVKNRTAMPGEPERIFRRSLISHVTSVDGRQPFTAKEEEAILRVLRRKQIWYAGHVHLESHSDTLTWLSQACFRGDQL